MNWACQAHLNRGFRAAEQYHTKCLKDVRAKLPRRESSRREHPYSRHCDILTAIGTRFEFYDQNQVYFQMIQILKLKYLIEFYPFQDFTFGNDVQ